MTKKVSKQDPFVAFDIEIPIRSSPRIRGVFHQYEADIDDDGTEEWVNSFTVETSDECDATGQPVWKTADDDAFRTLGLYLADALSQRPAWAKDVE